MRISDWSSDVCSSDLFPRVYVDANREPYELDPAMFDDALPDYVTTQNARIAAGLGTIARAVSNAAPVYRGKLSFADALHRIEICWRPFHAAPPEAIEGTLDRFGYCILLDPHAMPSNWPTVGPAGPPRPAAGSGTVARVVASAAPTYRGKPSFADALHRIEFCWRPFHAALA